MKDQNIYNQVVLEIVKDKENEFLSAADINRIASLVEKYYRQGYEDATKFQISLPKIYADGIPIKEFNLDNAEITMAATIMKDDE